MQLVRELELENFIFKDCKPVKQIVLAKLLMIKYKITGIIYIHTGMNEWVKIYT